MTELLRGLLAREDIVALLSAADRRESHAEAEYLVPEGRRLRRQIVDLLYQDETGAWHIVDYKSGQDGAVTRDRWSDQLARYRVLVEAAESGPVASTQILQATEGRFIDPDR